MSSSPLPAGERPTNVRYQILAAATAASVILYVHRAFISEVFKFPEISAALGINETHENWIFFAFFFPYALCQVPGGAIADSFGRRRSLTIYILAWSLCTALGGAVLGFVSLFVVRFGLGLAQAGAYPTCGGLVGRWMPPAQRAFGSAIVSSGGRVGGIISPVLTSLLISQWFVPWRAVMVLYGLVGVAIGVWFWIVSREDPESHPWCNDAERDLIAEGRVTPNAALDAAPQHVRAPVKEMLTNPSMWCMCVSQFGTNIGWAFIITVMPKYLTVVKQGGSMETGALMSMIWACGWAGMILGGKLTDATTRRFGLRWGRLLPTIVTRFIAAALYLIALQCATAWEAACVFAAVAFFCDLGVSAMWAFAQDVGGRSVGAVLGWGNMVGNLGAAVAALIYASTDKFLGTEVSRDGTLYAAMLGFVVSGIAALGINAAKPIVPEENGTAAA